MPLIEAFLALALTLLSLAMIATLIVELFHRIARTRAKNLRTMLEEFYDNAVEPRVKAELQKTAKKLEEHKTEFIDKLMSNPLIKGEKQAGLFESRLKDVVSLSTGDLFKKLANSDIGKKIKKKTEAEIDEAVDSLSRSYDEFGVAATDLFKRKAQIISLLVGILVAFFLNVNALSIFKSYLDDPQARAKAVAQADAALETFTKRTDNISGFTDKKEIVDHVNTIKKEIEGLGDTGIPIGYSKDKAPVSWFVKDPDSDWKKKAQLCVGIVFWAVGVFITGLLIGLGGPFWFNVVRKLTDVLQVVRGGAPTAAKPGGSATVPADPIKFNRDTFKMASKP